jgi:acyl-CoA synthetase (AMP-forming)/AMP-acid ligase II
MRRAWWRASFPAWCRRCATVTTPQALRAAGSAAAAAADHRGHGSEIAFIQYTSGSTGDPKGVTLDHANLLANIRAWGRAVALTPADVTVSWLPLYHDMGLIGAWLGSLYHACPLVLMSPLDFLARPERWLWAIHQHRGTVTAAPNFAFELCLRHLDPARLQASRPGFPALCRQRCRTGCRREPWPALPQPSGPTAFAPRRWPRSMALPNARSVSPCRRPDAGR